MKNPDEILIEMATTLQEHHEIYGLNYLKIGPVMDVLFPTGIMITNPEEWNRFHLFFMIVQKITRVACTNISHKDSIHDIGVYAAMLESLLEEK